MMLFDRGGNVCDSKASVALRPLRCAREHPGRPWSTLVDPGRPWSTLVDPGWTWCRTT